MRSHGGHDELLDAHQSNIEPMPHQIVRALMLERSTPQLRIAKVELASAGTYDVHLWITLENYGDVLATSVGLAVTEGRNERRGGLNGFVWSNRRIKITQEGTTYEPCLFHLAPDLVLYPGVSVEAAEITISVNEFNPPRDQEIHMCLFAEGFRSEMHTIRYTAAEILEVHRPQPNLS